MRGWERGLVRLGSELGISSSRSYSSRSENTNSRHRGVCNKREQGESECNKIERGSFWQKEYVLWVQVCMCSFWCFDLLSPSWRVSDKKSCTRIAVSLYFIESRGGIRDWLLVWQESCDKYTCPNGNPCVQLLLCEWFVQLLMHASIRWSDQMEVKVDSKKGMKSNKKRTELTNQKFDSNGNLIWLTLVFYEVLVLRRFESRIIVIASSEQLSDLLKIPSKIFLLNFPGSNFSSSDQIRCRNEGMMQVLE